MENELLNYLRDLGATAVKFFRDSAKSNAEQHKVLVSTVADEAITTRKLIKQIADEKEKPEKIDLSPVVKSQEAEANFTRKTIEAGTDEVKKLVAIIEKTTKEHSEASKSIKSAVESFKVSIPPFPEIKFPTVDFKVITEPLNKLFTLTKEGFNKMLARGTKEDPIYVKHLDPEGRPIDPTKVQMYGGAPASGSSSSGGADVVGIKKANDARINPATEETLANAYQALQDLGEGSSIKDVNDTLAQVNTLLGQFKFDEQGNLNTGIQAVSSQVQKIIQFLQRNTTIDPSTGQLRVLIGNASIAVTGSLTAVTTVTTLNQLAGFDAKQTLLYASDRSAWALNVRSRIV